MSGFNEGYKVSFDDVADRMTSKLSAEKRRGVRSGARNYKDLTNDSNPASDFQTRGFV